MIELHSSTMHFSTKIIHVSVTLQAILNSISSLRVYRSISNDAVYEVEDADICKGGHLTGNQCWCPLGKTFYSSHGRSSQLGCYGDSENNGISGCSCRFSLQPTILTINPQGYNLVLPKQVDRRCGLAHNATISGIYVWNLPSLSASHIWAPDWKTELKDRITYDPRMSYVKFQLSPQDRWDGLLIAIDFQQYDENDQRMKPRFNCLLVKFQGYRTYPLQGSSVLRSTPGTGAKLEPTTAPEPTDAIGTDKVEDQGGGFPVAAIVGVIVGVLIISVVVIIALFIYSKRRKNKEKTDRTKNGEKPRLESGQYKSLSSEGQIDASSYQDLCQTNIKSPMSPVYTDLQSPAYAEADPVFEDEQQAQDTTPLEKSIELQPYPPTYREIEPDEDDVEFNIEEDHQDAIDETDGPAEEPPLHQTDHTYQADPPDYYSTPITTENFPVYAEVKKKSKSSNSS